jgi:ornithine cyclodeaminase/alanine dehydrogenase-like protein (mu-crystallin family)
MKKSEGRLSKSGDLIQPIQQRVISREHIVGTLADLVQGSVPARTSPHEITMYKVWGYSGRFDSGTNRV